MNKNSAIDQLERTANYWDDHAGTWAIGRGRNWLEIPDVRARINCMVSGRPEIDAYQYLMQLLVSRGQFMPLDRVLTLGCGAGDLERGLFGIGFASRYEGIDVAEQAIERARAAASALGGADIIYKVANINNIKIEPNNYDVIFCPMSAHHFSDLENVFSEVHRALKVGGIFFLDEYIGPKRFQWPEHQIALVDHLLQSLPDRWVRMADGQLRRSFVPPSVEDVIAVDPSEAIRSDEILQVLSQQFVVTKVRGYGGSLLHGLLDNIGINFVQSDLEAKAMLNTFFALEDWALANGILEHDFAVIMAERPQDAGVPPGIWDPGWSSPNLVIAQRCEESTSLRAQLAAIKSSKSWRLTAPLRWLRRMISHKL
jgi:SAM-dependent methyltransferase